MKMEPKIDHLHLDTGYVSPPLFDNMPLMSDSNLPFDFTSILSPRLSPPRQVLNHHAWLEESISSDLNHH